MENMDAMMINSVTLDTLKPGDNAVIHGFRENNSETHYLMEMGLLSGTAVKLVKFAPLGDPLEICFRDYYLSIRRSIARLILVKVSSEKP